MKTITLIALGLVAGSVASQAQTTIPTGTGTYVGPIYDNTTTPAPYQIAPGVEFGDMITLYTPASEANTIAYAISRFAFEYYATGLSGGEQVRLRFYENDGPQNINGIERPGTPIYEGPLIDIENTEGGSIDLDFAPFLVPDIFTWTVEFTGLQAGEEAGLNTYTPPTLGENNAGYWQRDANNTFQLLFDQSANPIAIDFGAYAEGTVVMVPEPGTMGLLAFGALGLLTFGRRVKFRS